MLQPLNVATSNRNKSLTTGPRREYSVEFSGLGYALASDFGEEHTMPHYNSRCGWLILFVVSGISMTAPSTFAQSPSSLNGVYLGQLKEVTKSREPPCSPAQSARVVVENGVVIMPSLLLGAGQPSVMKAQIESDGSFIGKLVGAEMRGKIVGTTLNAKIIAPLRCVYDVAAARQQ